MVTITKMDGSGQSTPPRSCCPPDAAGAEGGGEGEGVTSPFDSETFPRSALEMAHTFLMPVIIPGSLSEEAYRNASWPVLCRLMK
jgi:hypothetical protein